MNTDTSKKLNEKKFNFFESFLNFLNAIFEHARKKGSSLSNEEFISYGRTDDEKNTIREICDDLDIHCELTKELDASCMHPQDWFTSKSGEILSKCDDETFQEIKNAESEITSMQIESETIILDNMSERISPEIIKNEQNIEGGK